MNTNNQYYTQKELSIKYNCTQWKISKIIKKNNIQSVGKVINNKGLPSKVYSSRDITSNLFEDLPAGTIILNDGTIIK